MKPSYLVFGCVLSKIFSTFVNTFAHLRQHVRNFDKFTHLRQSCRNCPQVFTRLHQPCGQFHAFLKPWRNVCKGTYTNEPPSILLSPCARLRKIGRTFAKLFRMAVQKINDENRQRQSQRKEPTAQHHAFREQTHHAPSYALPRPPLIPLVFTPRDGTSRCATRPTASPR